MRVRHREKEIMKANARRIEQHIRRERRNLQPRLLLKIEPFNLRTAFVVGQVIDDDSRVQIRDIQIAHIQFADKFSPFVRAISDMTVARLYGAEMEQIVMLPTVLPLERRNDKIEIVAVALRILQVDVGILQFYLMKNEMVLEKRQQFETHFQTLRRKERIALLVVDYHAIQVYLVERSEIKTPDTHFAPQLFRQAFATLLRKIILHRRDMDEHIPAKQQKRQYYQRTDQYFYKSLDTLLFLLKRKPSVYSISIICKNNEKYINYAKNKHFSSPDGTF